MGLDAMILVFWILRFKPAFSLLFHFDQEALSLSPIRMVLSAYLRLLIFLPAILIPACLLPAQVFAWCILHISQISRVTQSFPDLEPVHFFMSGSNCCFLIGTQVSQEAGKVFWYSQLFKNFSFDSMLNTFPIWYLPLQHPSPCSYTSERRPQRHGIARLNYCVTDTSLWLSLK